MVYVKEEPCRDQASTRGWLTEPPPPPPSPLPSAEMIIVDYISRNACVCVRSTQRVFSILKIISLSSLVCLIRLLLLLLWHAVHYSFYCGLQLSVDYMLNAAVVYIKQQYTILYYTITRESRVLVPNLRRACIICRNPVKLSLCVCWCCCRCQW